MQNRPPLRIGLMLNSFNQPAWIEHLIKEITKIEGCRIEVAILREENQETARNRLGKFWRERHHLIYHYYSKLDRRLTHLEPNAFTLCDVSALLTEVTHFEVRPQRKKGAEYLAPNDLAKIRAHDLDVILRLGFGILKGEILTLPRLGVWSFHHGDNDTNRGGPAGFWEVAEGRDVMGSILQILSEELDNGRVLAKSFSMVHPDSVLRTTNAAYWKSLNFVPRLLRRLRTEPLPPPPPPSPRVYSHRLYTRPTNRQALRLAVRLSLSPLRGLLRRVFRREQWLLYYRAEADLGTPLAKFKKIEPPRDRFWADPHVVWHEGIHHVFFEEFIYAENRGQICGLTIDREGHVSASQRVLERPYHLSYPCLFKWKDQFYMVPETAANRTIELYRCRRFPDQWVLEKNLFESINAVDTTVFPHDGRWWLLANVTENPGASSFDELSLFFTDDPVSGKWLAHPLNPVVSDARRARPGGAVFAAGGRLFRPAQICAPVYGYGLRLMEIERLSPTEYQEREVSRMEPFWQKGLNGVHTLAHVEGLTVVDARRDIRRI